MRKLDFYFKQYENSHLHPLNKLCHFVGIPMIILSLYFIIKGGEMGWILFVVGWVFQIVGHAIERSTPEFLSNPIYLFVGPLFLIHKVRRAVFKQRL